MLLIRSVAGARFAGATDQRKISPLNFLTPLFLIRPVVAMLLGVGVFGFSRGILFVAVQFSVAIASAYALSWAVAKLAASFGGTNDLLNALKLYGYSTSPALLAAILAPLPLIGAVVQFAAGLYSIYIFYQGSSPMLAVPAEQRLFFTVVSVLSVLVIGFLAGLLTLMMLAL